MTFTHALATNNYGEAKFIVAASAANGTHTTIAAALTAASSGDTIFIRQGTYTENITLKAGVNLCAYGPASAFFTPSAGGVIINGTCTMTTAGTVGINGIILQTNGATAALAVTGSAASIVLLENCYLNCTGNTGVTFSSSSASAQIQFEYCSGDITTTGIALFSHSSAGSLRFLHSSFGNSGGSTTNNTVSAGGFFPNYSSWANGTTVSNAAAMNGSHLDLTMSGNQTGLTTANTAAIGVSFATFTSGTSSAISLASGTSLQLHNVLVSSSNASPITGSGTLIYSNIVFNSVAAINNTVLRSPFPGSQSWTWIQTQTASASASISFTTGIVSQFNRYMLVWDNVFAASGGGQAMLLRYNQGSGFVTTGYAGTGVFGNTAGGPTVPANVTTFAILAGSLGSSVPACSGTCLIGNSQFSNSSGASYLTNTCNDRGSNGIGVYGGTFGNTAAITQLQITLASGNISQGTFSLYGIIS